MSAPDDFPSDISAHDLIIYKVGILRRQIERYANSAITEGFDTTIAEWRVLTHLFRYSSMTITELSAKLCADKAEVSRACTSLVVRGLVSRRRDERDARSSQLVITDRGRRLHNQIFHERLSQQNKLASVLTKAEHEILHTALDKLIAFVSGGGFQVDPPSPPKMKAEQGNDTNKS
jgi:DNA-binding MarR family transcriptional regulator